MSTKEVHFVDVFCEAMLISADCEHFISFKTDKFTLMIGRNKEEVLTPEYDKDIKA